MATSTWQPGANADDEIKVQVFSLMSAMAGRIPRYQLRMAVQRWR
jgi:hypothetical protein